MGGLVVRAVGGDGQGRDEVGGRCGARGPRGIRVEKRRPFENGEGLCKGLREEAQLGRQKLGGGCILVQGWRGLGWVRVTEGQVEEVDRVGKQGVEGSKRAEVYWMVGVDANRLLRKGAQTKVDGLFHKR